MISSLKVKLNYIIAENFRGIGIGIGIYLVRLIQNVGDIDF
jgi:hypothetical protein